MTFRVTWPELVAGPSPEIRRKINALILARLQPGDVPSGFEAESAAIMDEYRRFKEEFRDSAITYFVRRTAEIVWSTNSVLSIRIDDDSYKGGAHPNSVRSYLNLRPGTAEEISLDLILAPGALSALRARAERRFRKDRNLAEGASLSTTGFTFESDVFALPKTFGLSAEGLVFYYNDYEISSHATGPVTILLPWAEIRDLMDERRGVLP